MNPPLSQTARRWMLAMFLGGVALLAILLWLAFGSRPTAVPRAETATVESEPVPAASGQPGPKPHSPAPAPAPRPAPASAAPVAIGVRPTQTERDQLQPKLPLEERLHIKRAIEPLVGWVNVPQDAGHGR